MDTDVATVPVLSRAREIADLARGMADDIDSARRLPAELNIRDSLSRSPYLDAPNCNLQPLRTYSPEPRGDKPPRLAGASRLRRLLNNDHLIDTGVRHILN